MDYTSSHADGFDYNMHEVPDKIREVVTFYRSATIPGDTSGVRCAATRADVIGHSMGGVLTRLYVANCNGPATGINRRDGHTKIYPFRSSQNHYLRYNNWGSGDIRRFISIGAPFDGSNLANSMEAVKKGQKAVSVLDDMRANWRQYAKLANDALSGQGPVIEVGGPDMPWWDFPDAIIDLQPGSAIQALSDGAVYPAGRQRVLWHPIVGRVAVPLSDQIKEELLSVGLFQVPNFAASAVLGFDPGLNELNPMKGDLVVTESSQRNGNPAAVGTVFTQTLHATHSSPQLLALIQQLNLVSETASEAIVNRIRELLNSPSTSGDWTGDLSQ